MAATRMKLAGKVSDPLARLMVTTRSSSGWRRVSRFLLPNSGSSSRKRIPRWARLISPGLGQRPPPTSPAWLMVWWGERKGRRAHQRFAVGQGAGHRVDARDVQRFAEGQPGQDRGQRPRQQRLAGAGRSFHETVVAAGAGDLQRTLGLFLPLDVREIDGVDHLFALVKAQRCSRSGQ